SDALCRLATGGGFGTRELYSDSEEILFNARRPVLLTSITDVVTAGDLLDRAIPLQLQVIEESKRRTEEALWAEFEEARPSILGALLDAVVAGLRALPGTKLEKLPRMADFAVWAEAVMRGTGHRPGAFVAAYEANRRDTNALTIDASLVGPVL